MDRMMLLHVENRLLKAILLKSIAQADFGVLDVIDVDDLSMKMDAFGAKVCLMILEITDWNQNAIQVELNLLKNSPFQHLPIMAVVSKDTADVVTFAMKSGIRDVFLLPKQRELYRKTVCEKMSTYYQQFLPPVEEKPKERNLFEELLENPNLKETLSLEIQRAQRGSYALTLVLAHLSGEKSDFAKNLYQRVKGQTRATDKVLMIDDETFMGVFPFAQKDHTPIIEQKIREAYDLESRKQAGPRKLNLFTATYPDDDTSLDMLLERLENGVNNSIVINSIRTPLNALSKTEIENFKQKIRQYRRFF
ncbi:MAG: hypothetical protein N2376_14420 [Clostridia bacterium]|nr:hypothetical protein [Clostridia bacterium]